MDGNSAPPADAAGPTGDAAPPVQSNVNAHGVHHDQGTTTPDNKSVASSTRRVNITPRPTFLENLANSRDSQFMLDRRNSSEIDRYFVCRPRTPYLAHSVVVTRRHADCPRLCSTVLAISINTQNGPSSCECMGASCRN